MTAVGERVTADEELVERRRTVMGPSYRLLYDPPVHFVRGTGVHLYDPAGEEYLDAYNNVPCVGHAHPAVSGAVAAQAGLINTNTRYLQAGVVDYAERLVGTLPDELGNVMFTCTGSEANDLTLRVARFVTGNAGVIVTENAYHGVTQAVAAMSPSLGEGVDLAPHVRVIPAPDLWASGMEPLDFADLMVRRVEGAVADLRRHGHGVSALVLDSVFSSDGILPGPTGWIARAAQVVRDAGGLYVADEVQSGFGRLGTGMWGFPRHRVVPDIVTMGKSMGNGFPIAAAVFRPELLEEFGPRVRYFNTFGGNSVSVAAASAVLDVIEGEGLVGASARVGGVLTEGLGGLAVSDPRIGCVRGIGLVQGVVLVSDEDGRTPDPDLARRVVNGLRQRHVLIGSCGKDGNVLKIRPPLVFGVQDAARLVEALADVLAGIPAGAVGPAQAVGAGGSIRAAGAAGAAGPGSGAGAGVHAVAGGGRGRRHAG